MGLMSDDSNASAVPPMLAELMGIPHATAVVKVEKTGAGVRVERELEGGALEVVDLPLPVPARGADRPQPGPLRVAQGHHGREEEADRRQDGRGARPRRQGRRRRRQGRSIQKIYPPPKGDGAEILSGSADEVVTKLVGKIKELGLL